MENNFDEEKLNKFITEKMVEKITDNDFSLEDYFFEPEELLIFSERELDYLIKFGKKDLAKKLNQARKLEPDVKVISDKEIIKNISDWRWRINNLYKIVTDEGVVTQFVTNPVQTKLLDEFHNRMWILKSRQHGATTLFSIVLLDQVLFLDDKRAAIIAHTQSAAKMIFKTRIKFPYDNLPKAIKRAKPSITKNSLELALANGSIFYVTLSTRSGTLHYVLISELGYVYYKDPSKANEIVTGTAESVAPSQCVIVESTPYGLTGFYDLTMNVQKTYKQEKNNLHNQMYKFIFLPWFSKPANISSLEVNLTEKEDRYYKELQQNEEVILTKEQINWHVAKWRLYGDSQMFREHPSSPEEAFKTSADGAFFTDEMAAVYSEGRILSNLYDPNIPVWISWDLGMGDLMVLIFFQIKDGKFYAIHTYSNNNKALDFYINYIQNSKFGFTEFTTLCFPHDITNRDVGLKTGETRLSTIAPTKIRLKNGKIIMLKDLRIKKVPRVGSKKEDIDLVKLSLKDWYFDGQECVNLISALSRYSRIRNDETGVYSNFPTHDIHSHYADAFMCAVKGPKTATLTPDKITPY